MFCEAQWHNLPGYLSWVSVWALNALAYRWVGLTFCEGWPWLKQTSCCAGADPTHQDVALIGLRRQPSMPFGMFVELVGGGLKPARVCWDRSLLGGVPK